MTDQLKPLSKEDRIAQAEPGSAGAIVHAVFDLAEKECGHNPSSARHGLTTIRKWIMDAKARINELEKDRDRWQKQAEEWDQYTHDLEVQREKLVEALKKQCGIAFHSANCAFDGANNPCDCGIEQAKAVLREIGEGGKG